MVGKNIAYEKSPHSFTCKGLEKLVGRAGVEPATLCLTGVNLLSPFVRNRLPFPTIQVFFPFLFYSV